MRCGALVGIVLAMVCLVMGCQSAGPRGGGSGDDAGATIESLLYYEWLGTSPGAGFTRTDLIAVEIDFINGRTRRIHLRADHPAPMIDMPGEERPEALAREPWAPLSAEEDEAIRSAVRSWLDVQPREISDHARSVGRESGYILRFTLRTTGKVYRVRVNPPPDDAAPMVMQDRAYPAFLKVKSALIGDGFIW